jgi:hypothetical protein
MGKDTNENPYYGSTVVGSPSGSDKDNESLHSEDIPGRRQIGVISAVFIIFNRMIGTG